MFITRKRFLEELEKAKEEREKELSHRKEHADIWEEFYRLRSRIDKLEGNKSDPPFGVPIKTTND